MTTAVRWFTHQGGRTAQCRACGNTASAATDELTLAMLHSDKPCRGTR